MSKYGEKRWEKKIEEWVPYDQKRNPGRPIARWRDEIVKEFGVGWKQKAKNRDNWKKMGEAYAQKWVLG